MYRIGWKRNFVTRHLSMAEKLVTLLCSMTISILEPMISRTRSHAGDYPFFSRPTSGKAQLLLDARKGYCIDDSSGSTSRFADCCLIHSQKTFIMPTILRFFRCLFLADSHSSSVSSPATNSLPSSLDGASFARPFHAKHHAAHSHHDGVTPEVIRLD